ncbi:hypothetical protein, partial [Rhizobacter sp. P5_C2]
MLWLAVMGCTPGFAQVPQSQPYQYCRLIDSASVPNCVKTPAEIPANYEAFVRTDRGAPGTCWDETGTQHVPALRVVLDAYRAATAFDSGGQFIHYETSCNGAPWLQRGSDPDFYRASLCPNGLGWSEALGCTVVYTVPWARNPPAGSCPLVADPAVGNPIYPLRGAKREVVDAGVAIGRMSLQFTYDMSGMIPKVPQALAALDAGDPQRGGVLGSALWSSNLHRRVGLGTRSVGARPNLPVPTTFQRGDGTVKTMLSTNGAALVAEPGNADRFTALADGRSLYLDSRANVQETYTAQGTLMAMAWADGPRMDFSYDAAGLLSRVVDNRGRSLEFSYADPGAGAAWRLSTVTDATGRVTTLSHDAQNRLTGFGWPDGTGRALLYERSDLPWALTGVRDERNVRYSTFGYDGEGRAISTEHADGVDRHSVSYATPPSIQITEQAYGTEGVVRYSTWNVPQGTVLTRPNGNASSLEATGLNGKNYMSGQSQAAGAGCGASASAQAYDANGNAASLDDFNGTRSCYASDQVRNLRVASISGLSQTQDCAALTPANAVLSAGARKTSTQWHPDWSLPTKVAEPGQITTSVYTGQPDPFNGNAIASCEPGTAPLLDGKPIAVLCKQVTQATTDADGHLGFSAALQAGAAARVSTWTYNEFGQVLTAKITRGGVTVTASSTYFADTDANHTKGDLATTTDAAGKVTAYDKYTRAGQLLQSTDPDGVVTVNTYDLRQRLLTTTVGGETTTYGYDPVGQLILVTQHDGSWIAYEYDDAHRQKAVSDDRTTAATA